MNSNANKDKAPTTDPMPSTLSNYFVSPRLRASVAKTET